MRKLSILLLCSLVALAQNTITEQMIISNEQTWQENIHQLWLHALVKVSGQMNIANNPKVIDNEVAASAAVQSYHYDGNKMTVIFSTKSIHTFLRSIHATIWQEARPTLYLWLTEAAYPPFQAHSMTAPDVVQQAALDRAITIEALPITEPQTQWCLQHHPHECLQVLRQAFQQSYILWGAQYRHQTSWVLQAPDHRWTWFTKNDVLPAIHQAIDQMAARLARNEAPDHHFRIRLLGIPSFDIHQKLVTIVQSMPEVSQVTVNDLGPGYAVLQLDVALDLPHLSKKLAQNQLRIIEKTNAKDDLTLTWIPSP
jgi:hypothetical protein